MNTYGLLMSIYVKDSVPFLDEALASCDFDKLSEVVIVCDGPVSEDHLVVVRNRVPVNLLRIIRLDENVGLGLALNRGLRECTTDYVFRMDSDDICYPDRFDSQIEFLEKVPCDVLGGQIFEFSSEPDGAGGARNVPSDTASISSLLRFRNPINHVTVCFSRAKILSIGSYRHVLYHEDYDLWIRAISNQLHVVNMAKRLVMVRSGRGFIERRHGLRYLMYEWQFVRKNLGFFKFSAIPYLLFRSFLRLGPKSVLNFVYLKFLRS